MADDFEHAVDGAEATLRLAQARVLQVEAEHRAAQQALEQWGHQQIEAQAEATWRRANADRVKASGAAVSAEQREQWHQQARAAEAKLAAVTSRQIKLQADIAAAAAEIVASHAQRDIADHHLQQAQLNLERTPSARRYQAELSNCMPIQAASRCWGLITLDHGCTCMTRPHCRFASMSPWMLPSCTLVSALKSAVTFCRRCS